jgi:DNA-binding CsgD family transcriptional regulator
LDLTVRRVKANLTTLFLKLGVSSRTEAISVGLKSGLITLGELKE